MDDSSDDRQIVPTEEVESPTDLPTLVMIMCNAMLHAMQPGVGANLTGMNRGVANFANG